MRAPFEKGGSRALARRGIYSLNCILSLYLTGCATLPPQNINATFPIAQTTSPKKEVHLQSWNIQGKIAVKTEQKGWNASFNWLQKHTHYDLNIFGPLGSGRVSLIGEGQHAILTANQRSYESNDVETLLAQQLGWYMPVNNVRYWIQGIPAPGAIARIIRNNEGQLVVIEQQGWRIKYQSYNKINGLYLPIFIEMENPRVSIRIVIHEWMF